MSRFQYILKWLFVAMLAVVCFFGGIQFERERARREKANEVEYILVKPWYDPPLNTD